MPAGWMSSAAIVNVDALAKSTHTSCWEDIVGRCLNGEQRCGTSPRGRDMRLGRRSVARIVEGEVDACRVKHIVNRRGRSSSDTSVWAESGRACIEAL
jgi:hypothetical protein